MGGILRNTDNYSDCLIRLPMYFELSDEQVDWVISNILEYYKV